MGEHGYKEKINDLCEMKIQIQRKKIKEKKKAEKSKCHIDQPHFSSTLSAKNICNESSRIVADSQS